MKTTVLVYFILFCSYTVADDDSDELGDWESVAARPIAVSLDTSSGSSSAKTTDFVRVPEGDYFICRPTKSAKKIKCLCMTPGLNIALCVNSGSVFQLRYRNDDTNSFQLFAPECETDAHTGLVTEYASALEFESTKSKRAQIAGAFLASSSPKVSTEFTIQSNSFKWFSSNPLARGRKKVTLNNRKLRQRFQFLQGADVFTAKAFDASSIQ